MIKLKNTQDAISFGENATPKQISKIQVYRIKFEDKYNKALKEKDLDKALKYSHAAQLMSEAIVSYKQDPAYRCAMAYIKGVLND